MLQKLLFLCIAGAAGTLARYWLSGIVQKNISTDFPVGTAVVNICGCLLFGLLWAITEDRLSISGQNRTIIFLGFFGAFTTFSSFAYETSQLLEESQWLWATGNILFQNVLGIAGMIAGLAIGKWI
jgi:fluoride exporter